MEELKEEIKKLKRQVYIMLCVLMFFGGMIFGGLIAAWR